MERERICRGCEKTEELTQLQRCGICSRWYCPDCAQRAVGGRKFCSPECAKAYYFHGEPDDDEDDEDLRAEE